MISRFLRWITCSIRRVARRIIDEAVKGRRWLYSAHDLLFFNEVADAAARAAPQVPVAKRIITKSSEHGFGLISEKDEPWIARKVNDRISAASRPIETLLDGEPIMSKKRTEVRSRIFTRTFERRGSAWLKRCC